MDWLFPGFLAGALAIGLPIALHLLRRFPRRPIVFPSLRFLVVGSRKTDSWWQRLKRWLVLARYDFAICDVQGFAGEYALDVRKDRVAARRELDL